jgi:hypothetical protein
MKLKHRKQQKAIERKILLVMQILLIDSLIHSHYNGFIYIVVMRLFASQANSTNFLTNSQTTFTTN